MLAVGELRGEISACVLGCAAAAAAAAWLRMQQ
jgi:hypothetical protein